MRSKRHLSAAEQLEIDNQVRRLIENPLLGERKSGALKGVRVLKFKVGVQHYLLAYRFFSKRNVIEVLDVGSHENFIGICKGTLRPGSGGGQRPVSRGQRSVVRNQLPVGGGL